MARQADDADIMAEIFAAKLCAHAQLLRELVNFRFHFKVTESMARFRSFGGEMVKIAG